MNKHLISKTLLITLLGSVLNLSLLAPANAGSKDDPLLTSVMFDELEWRDSGSDESFNWDVQAWVGKDLNKLWFKAEGEREKGKTESAEWQVLYNRAVTPFWDVQLGLRHDSKPAPNRDWAVLGVQGVAPYFVEIDASFFLGEAGQTALRFEAEYEVMITQRWVLTPDIEMNFHGRNDAQTNTGSGLSEIEAGLRLHYEVSREFAPYLGVNWSKAYGKTADFSRTAGEKAQNTAVVVGVKLWF